MHHRRNGAIAVSPFGPIRGVLLSALVVGFLCFSVSPPGCAARADEIGQPRDFEPDSRAWQDTLRLVREDFPEVPQMTTRQLADLLDADPASVVLLDARSTEEHEVGHLQGAVQANGVRAALDVLPGLGHLQQGPEPTVVVYCSVGYRSSQLAERLRERGLSSVFNLEGSIFRWANEGRPIHRGDVRVYEVHPYDDDWGRLLHPRFWPD